MDICKKWTCLRMISARINICWLAITSHNSLTIYRKNNKDYHVGTASFSEDCGNEGYLVSDEMHVRYYFLALLSVINWIVIDPSHEYSVTYVDSINVDATALKRALLTSVESTLDLLAEIRLNDEGYVIYIKEVIVTNKR